MSVRDIDWRYLTAGTMLRLVLCAIAVAALIASAWLRGDMAARAAVQGSELAGLETQRRELGERLAARQRFADRYAALAEAGIVGEEQRLAWTQALRDGATALQLPYLRFTAAPRQPFAASYLVPDVTAPVLVTPMDLQAGLVHELDLLRLVERLHEQAPGLLGVAGCTLERVAADQPPQPDKANVTAACQLHWYSIQLPGAMLAMEGGE
ncbi:MAG: hypothetical protein IT486_05505 [Gammaproteobacteria bacterium]|nr:hypothetical protein [Gammaproteobacteria bacterium]